MGMRLTTGLATRNARPMKNFSRLWRDSNMAKPLQARSLEDLLVCWIHSISKNVAPNAATPENLGYISQHMDPTTPEPTVYLDVADAERRARWALCLESAGFRCCAEMSEAASPMSLELVLADHPHSHQGLHCRIGFRTGHGSWDHPRRGMRRRPTSVCPWTARTAKSSWLAACSCKSSDCGANAATRCKPATPCCDLP